MSSNFPDLEFSDDEDFNADRLNKAMQTLDARLRALEPFTPSWQAAVDELRLVGLIRLNETIYPAYERIQQLASLGFLTADSTTEVTLVNDTDVTFFIDDEIKRDLFVPTPFVAVTRASNATDYAIGRRISYDRLTGKMVVRVMSIYGNPGPFNDWIISATAGSQLAAQAYLAQIEAARVNAFASRTSAAADAARTASDRIQTGSDTATTISARDAAIAAANRAEVWDPQNYLAKADNLASLTDKTVARTSLELGNTATRSAATAAELRSKANNAIVTNDKAWDASQWVDLGNVTGAITINANNGCRFYGVMTGNVTVDVSNLKNGQPIEIVLMQDATGNRTVSWATKFKWPSATVPGVGTTANGYGVIVTGIGGWGTDILAAGWKVTA
jgi:hypothetical protein